MPINDPNIIVKAVKEFQNGSIVVFPTDTSYGMGTIGLKSYEKSIKKIYEIKIRPMDKPLSLLITRNMIQEFIKTTPPLQEFLEEIWPSRLTLVLRCNSNALQTLSPLLNINNPQKLAFRVPKHKLLLRIIDKVGSPIIGTSANLSGSPTKYDIDSVFKEISYKDIQFTIDAGRLPQNPPSTLIDLTDPLNPIILREGDIDFQEIFKDYKTKSLIDK